MRINLFNNLLHFAYSQLHSFFLFNFLSFPFFFVWLFCWLLFGLLQREKEIFHLWWSVTVQINILFFRFFSVLYFFFRSIICYSNFLLLARQASMDQTNFGRNLNGWLGLMKCLFKMIWKYKRFIWWGLRRDNFGVMKMI